jgi:predicted RND superfamily exporter protein
VDVERLLSAVVGGAARRPWATIGVAVALALGATALALGLQPSAAEDTFVGKSSATYRATQRFYANFGEEPVQVLVQGSVQQLVLSSDLPRLAGLEGCLSGNVPAKAFAQEGGASGPCAQLAKAHTVKVVLGPGTFINEAAEQVDAQLSSQDAQAQRAAHQAEVVVRRAALGRGLTDAQARQLGAQASRITLTRYAQEVLTLGLHYGLNALPSVSEPGFVSALVFSDSAPRSGTPKQRFAYLFPGREMALVSVRMRAGLSEAQRSHTLALIRAAVAMPQWQLAHGERYLVSGEPAIVADLTGSVSHALELLLVAVAVAMALALGLVFGGRPRLLALAVAALAVALVFGGLALVSGQLTIAQVAVLPVLVGLTVDYTIQFQSRTPAASILLACLASMAAFLVFVLSPVPMVRGFGMLLALGLAVAFICALTVGAAAMRLAEQRPPARLGGWLEDAWQGARELVRDNPLSRGVSRAALGLAVQRPGRVLAVGAALAALGWGLDTQTAVQSDITKLVPQNTASLHNLRALQRESGVGGEIDLMVSGRNVTQARTIEWMGAYQTAVLDRYGYSEAHGCGKALLCPAFSLPDLFDGGEAGEPAGGRAAAATQAKAPQAKAPQAKITQDEVDALLSALPPYFTQEVIAPDRRVATLAFGIRLMSLAQQQQVIEAMRSELHPPAGVEVQLVGLPVLAAQADAQVASVTRRMLTLLAALAAVGLVLLLAFAGDWRRALAPLLPVVLATGWSALIVFLLGVPLNPMSVTLGALVVAVASEFSVLLAERYRRELLAGYTAVEALARSYRRTGAAVAASGVSAIAGFGVLALSDIQMLRDFGIVTLIDLAVSLIGVLVALPAALLVVGRWKGVRAWPRRVPRGRRVLAPGATSAPPG